MSDKVKPAGQARPTLPLWTDFLIDACGHCEAGFHFEEGGCFGFALALHGELSKIQPAAQIGVSSGFSHCVVLMGPMAVDHQGDLPLESTPKYTPVDPSGGVYEAAAQAGHSRGEVDGDVAWAREVISAAKSLCHKHREDAEFPLILVDAGEIADHADETTPGRVDIDMLRDLFFGAQAVLVKVLTACVEPDATSADNHVAVPSRNARYKKLPADTAPPILLGDDGRIVDGHHRLRAAVARNDKWVLAYQVLDEDIDLGLSADLDVAIRARRVPL